MQERLSDGRLPSRDETADGLPQNIVFRTLSIRKRLIRQQGPMEPNPVTAGVVVARGQIDVAECQLPQPGLEGAERFLRFF